MTVDEFTQGEKVTLGGALLVVFGAILPWTSGTGLAASGLAGNGIFAAVFAMLAGVLVATGDWDRDVHLAVLGLGALTALVALAALVDVTIAPPGEGLYLTVAGGAAVAAGGGFGYAVRRDPERVVEPAD